MKISAKDEYACLAVLDLAMNYDPDQPIRVMDIAQRQGIPMKFLFQIMQILKRVDLVRSRRGTEGGYVLARSPSKITVGDVLRFVRGPDVQLACLDSPDLSRECNLKAGCEFKPVWAQVERAIASVLDSITFEELARRAKAGEKRLMYHI